jgi:two-component system cell cycle response regulator DivK
MRTGTVLTIEDDVATAGLIRDALEAVGYRVLHAVGGAGIAVACAEHPDVILLDINMPGMDGPEVSRRLRADPAVAHIPIVCMSSHVARGGAPPGMPHDDRLPKPVALDVPRTTVARWGRTKGSDRQMPRLCSLGGVRRRRPDYWLRPARPAA